MDADWIPAYPYTYLFYWININMINYGYYSDTNMHIYIYFNRYGYNLDSRSMNITMDIDWIIKLNNYRIIDIIK